MLPLIYLALQFFIWCLIFLITILKPAKADNMISTKQRETDRSSQTDTIEGF